RSDALEMLDIHRRNHVNFGAENFLDVLIPLTMLAAGNIGVGQLIEKNYLRPAGNNRVDVHLFKNGSLIFDFPARNRFELIRQFGNSLSAMRFDNSDNHVLTITAAANPL